MYSTLENYQHMTEKKTPAGAPLESVVCSCAEKKFIYHNLTISILNDYSLIFCCIFHHNYNVKHDENEYISNKLIYAT